MYRTVFLDSDNKSYVCRQLVGANEKIRKLFCWCQGFFILNLYQYKSVKVSKVAKPSTARQMKRTKHTHIYNEWNLKPCDNIIINLEKSGNENAADLINPPSVRERQ